MRSPKRLLVLSICSALTIVPLMSSASSHAGKRTVVGTWRTVVTLVNCQTGQPVGAPTISGLASFHSGGTMSEFGVGPGSSPALRSPSHGVWQREHGWQDYSLTFMHYRYDSSGGLIGSQKVTADLELDASGDAYASTAAVEILDVNNNTIDTKCAVSAATRFE